MAPGHHLRGRPSCQGSCFGLSITRTSASKPLRENWGREVGSNKHLPNSCIAFQHFVRNLSDFPPTLSKNTLSLKFRWFLFIIEPKWGAHTSVSAVYKSWFGFQLFRKPYDPTIPNVRLLFFRPRLPEVRRHLWMSWPVSAVERLDDTQPPRTAVLIPNISRAPIYK